MRGEGVEAGVEGGEGVAHFSLFFKLKRKKGLRREGEMGLGGFL